MQKFTHVLLAAVILLTAFAAHAADITGAGATFPAPLYAKWAEGTNKSIGINLNYQAIGSGGGQTQIINRTVDFGASDAPMDAKKLADSKLLQVPTVMGAVVLIVNIPGIEPNQLKLAPDVLVDIYRGKIKSWDDQRITKDNASIKLPKLAIAPVYRADGSGTTYVFTTYLRTISYDWLKTVGNGTSVKWPAGNGAKGNDGVAATVQQLKGSIGYVESVYASHNKLTTVQLRNMDKQWVSPTKDSFKSAAATAEWKKAKDYNVDLINQPGSKSWPIVSATFLLIPVNAKDPAASKTVVSWLTWVYANGDKTAEELEYVPLPIDVKADVLKKLQPLVK